MVEGADMLVTVALATTAVARAIKEWLYWKILWQKLWWWMRAWRVAKSRAASSSIGHGVEQLGRWASSPAAKQQPGNHLGRGVADGGYGQIPLPTTQGGVLHPNFAIQGRL